MPSRHPDIDREIALTRKAIRRLAFESVDSTPTLSFDVGYGWTLLNEPDGDGGAELWVRALVPPFDYDDELTLLLFDWRAGSFAPHKHTQRETLHCLRGSFALVIEDGEEDEVRAGEAVDVPALVRHAGRCIEPCLIVGVYSPPLPLIPNPLDS